MPTACTQAGDVCSLPPRFVERLCRAQDVQLAMALFHGKSPWTRAYVRGEMEAWYASARRSRPRKLKYAEEVIVVASRQPAEGSFTVNGGGSFDVVRWDGACVSLMEGELSFRSPGTPDVATIQWKRLDDELATLLAKDRKIAYQNDRRRKACKGGSPNPTRCERAKKNLSHMIAKYVRAGGELPPPNLEE